MSTILVVEDDKNISKALQIRLGSCGYDVIVAHDAPTAGIAARKGKPDMAILDVSLPGGDGFLVAQRLDGVLGQSIPKIIITASKKPELRDKATACGAIAFFEKPYHGDELLAAVALAT